jgi:hypothetical protein
MAVDIVGYQQILRAQTMTDAFNKATSNCMRNKRRKLAHANSPTPRGVNGCQAVGRWSTDGSIIAVAISVNGAPRFVAAELRKVRPLPRFKIGKSRTRKI